MSVFLNICPAILCVRTLCINYHKSQKRNLCSALVELATVVDKCYKEAGRLGRKPVENCPQHEDPRDCRFLVGVDRHRDAVEVNGAARSREDSAQRLPGKRN